MIAILACGDGIVVGSEQCELCSGTNRLIRAGRTSDCCAERQAGCPASCTFGCGGESGICSNSRCQRSMLPPPPPPGRVAAPPPSPQVIELILQSNICSQSCDHQGLCGPADTCEACHTGWTGRYCGTLADTTAKLIALIVPCFVVGLLALAAMIILWHHYWRPIRARGVLSVWLSAVCGAIWIYAAFVHVRGEDGGYNIDNWETWWWWVTMVPGFGGWLITQTLHLRFLVKIHVFERIPVALWFEFALLLPAIGIPVAAVQKPWLLTVITAWLWLYLCMLFSVRVAH
eukprot:SAG31_NODE_2577_length_5451_cov_3.176757_4_plen_288_part_00